MNQKLTCRLVVLGVIAVVLCHVVASRGAVQELGSTALPVAGEKRQDLKSSLQHTAAPLVQNFYPGVNALVTGGAGFIGSHIVEQLVALGANVTVLDNFSTGSKANLKNVWDKIECIEGDITNLDDCLRAAHNKTIVFHLAAEISVPASMIDPYHCHKINVVGTLTILEAARRCGVQRFVFSSSSAVYGPQDGVCSEDLPCNPTSPYGYSKFLGEQLCFQYSHLFNVGSVCLRYFNVYGNRQNPNGAYAAVVAKFKDAMRNNKPITLFGDGSQTRDFIPVEKVAQANLHLGALPLRELTGQVFNIATGTSITVNQLFEKLNQEFPEYVQLAHYAPAREGDIQHSSADCTRFQKITSQYS